MNHADDERADCSEQITHELGHAGEMRGHMRIRRTQHNDRQRHRDQSTLTDALKHGPEPDRPKRSEKQAQ